jgi:hypothetical protein
MPIKFYNTYSRQIEEFTPIAPPHVKLYTCGPTVYSYAHIGNFRAYVFEDLLQRHLEARDFDVQRVMNLTDVDDKTIRGSREAGISLVDFTAKFKQSFFEDLESGRRGTKRMVRRVGMRRGEKEDRVGISSAAQWQLAYWARNSISTAAVSTIFSRIMKRRSRNLSA